MFLNVNIGEQYFYREIRFMMK